MSIYFHDDVMTVYHGDAITELKGLPDESVNCCVTSPPYWGLRNYEVEGQIGLEETMEEYLEKLMKVFREVRRVLKDDGTAWINMGSSYAYDGMNPSQSPLLWRVPAYDNDGTERVNSQSFGHAYCDSYDESQALKKNHHDYKFRNGQFCSPIGQQTLKTDHDIEQVDCGQASFDVLYRDARESTTHESFSQHLASSFQEAKDVVDQKERGTSLSDARVCVDRADCIFDNSLRSPPLVVRTLDKESFFSACSSPDCKGIGRCGLCFINITIPSMNIKKKDEINIPHLLAMALQSDGWVLRQTIIWAKPQPMPESVYDRPTKSHEYIFLLSKSKNYYYDYKAIMEPCAGTAHPRGDGVNKKIKAPNGWDTDSGSHGSFHREGRGTGTRYSDKEKNRDAQGLKIGARMGREAGWRQRQNESFSSAVASVVEKRNKRSVWTVPTFAYSEAHFATFPPDLIKPCILAGCPVGGTVLDPFAGSGTTPYVSKELNRKSIAIELKKEYCKLILKRTSQSVLDLGV